MINEVHLHRDDIETIKQFMAKFPDTEFVTITSDSSSGIGSIVEASVKASLNGDFVKVTKTIMDESSW
jgi:hypothetical protein